MATSLREGHSRQSSHLSQGDREDLGHSHSERDASLNLLPHSRQSSLLSALSDSFSSSYYSHSLSSHSRQTSLLSSHRSSPSSHSRVSSLLSDSTSPYPTQSFYSSQAQGLAHHSDSPQAGHRLQQNGNHCRQPSASSSHSRFLSPHVSHTCIICRKPIRRSISLPGRVTTTLVTATRRHCDQDTRDTLPPHQLTLTHMYLVTVKALDRDLDLVMAKDLDLVPSLVPIVGRAAMTGNLKKFKKIALNILQ